MNNISVYQVIYVPATMLEHWSVAVGKNYEAKCFTKAYLLDTQKISSWFKKHHEQTKPDHNLTYYY